ncbi:Glycine cleavage T protein (Aminomethyl transferase) [Desulfosarcina cetonica]|uniref:aminomethyltransferase family protein n=1 Tax=Desulfosarcina cetonica TaxID=90730 RepID=UPI0006D14D72|nr:glycine cleavage system protein T [Desulfosarcina cetonica]VTR69396.1 Glycine cleavage T protein (Aminomethyl transferase) [Desulfosarcina cetonica]
MQTIVKQTPLNAWHRRQGANMADFGGYDMPLWYSSVKDEHLAVLTGAGIFDTSHMAAVSVYGAGAADLLQACFTNNLEACVGPARKPLSPGRCVYGAFLDENGCSVDDAIVFLLAAGHYMVVVNAGMGATVADHLRRHQGGRDVVIDDLTDRLGKMDVQGPAAAKVLAPLLADPAAVLRNMPYFSFKGDWDAASPRADAVRLADGTPILLSRTGYTGEFGFEIFLAPDRLQPLWDHLLTTGQAFGVRACGLAARDSLRAGAMLPLSHQDIGHWPFINHPWPFALPFNADQTGFTKDFIGRQALENLTDVSFTHAFVGSDLRKVTAGADSRVIDADGRTIGHVLTCVTDMGIGMHDGAIVSVASPDRPAGFKAKGLCCGFVRVDRKLNPGQHVDIADARRKLAVTIVTDIRPHRTARKPMKAMI